MSEYVKDLDWKSREDESLSQFWAEADALHVPENGDAIQYAESVALLGRTATDIEITEVLNYIGDMVRNSADKDLGCAILDLLDEAGSALEGNNAILSAEDYQVYEKLAPELTNVVFSALDHHTYAA